MEELTDRQSALFAFLREQQALHGYPPSIPEICQHFGFASPQSAVNLLDRLEQKGAIARTPGARRSIRLLAPPLPDRSRQIPYLGRIAAGTPITAGFDAAELAEKYVDIDPALFAERPSFCHDVVGESMINASIHHGDRVFTSRRESFRAGQIVTAMILDPETGDPGFTVKVYERKRSIITLHSRNDDLDTFKPMRFDSDRDFIQVMGIFCGLLRGAAA